jgi:hypothetical protein
MDDISPPHRPIADLTSWELLRRAIEYRLMAMTARGRATIAALDRLAIRYALLAAKREVDEASHPSSSQEAETHLEQSELAKLIDLAGQAAADVSDPVRALADAVRTVAEGNADPYLVMGVLVEGAVHTLETRIPVERREDTAAALLHLVANRLRASGKPEA